jgi:hypothetical protein
MIYTKKRRAPSHPALVIMPNPRGLRWNRWLQFVKLGLALPHVVVAAVLSLAATILALPAGLSVLATRRLPGWLFAFLLGVDRYNTRVSAYLMLMCDQWPPFSLKEGGYPCDLILPAPERHIRWLPLVKWLGVLPHVIVLAIIYLFAPFSTLFAFFGILLNRRYPEGLYDLNLGFLRWQARTLAYVWQLTDRYPPYQLEE